MLLEPTALASALRYLAEALEQDYARDPGPLFAKAGCPIDRTRESGARVSQPAARHLWTLSIAATGDPAFGLNVGRRIKPEGLHALGYAWMSSRNLADALNRFCRYVEVLITIPTKLAVTAEAEGYRLACTFPDPAHQPHEAGIDATLLALVSLATQAAGKPVRPLAVWLQHPCRADRARYTAAFGAPVNFDAPTNGLLIDTAAAEALLPTDNPAIAAAVDQVAERYVAKLQAQPVAANVRDMLVQLLPTGEADQETIARKLNRSLSTLQRQLQAEGLSYRQVVDQTRHSLAKAYLSDKRFSQAEIAYLLGFSDQSSFSRAYRRWTGRSPGRPETRLQPVEQQHDQPEHQAGRRTTDNADEGVEVAHGTGSKHRG
ncbi:MAG: helix-turn-helix transcriptional regulator [Gammaproteobacteria bacterium]|nr:helix-turn-helix transcriptional regulator [Gammaproteobacteria bacterium]